MKYEQTNAASRWISVEEFLPHNDEIIAFCINHPRQILLFGTYLGDDKDGFFVNYLDAQRCVAPERFLAGSGHVSCWCRMSYPQEVKTQENKNE